MRTAVVILGHAYGKNYGHSKRQVKRLNKGIEIFNKKGADYILTTGGIGRSFNNTATPMSILMAEYIKQHGISENKIRYETESTNTYENAMFLREVISELGVTKLYIVTSWDHLLRSKLIFRDVYPKLDLEMINSDFFAGWWTIFDLGWQIIGLVKYFLSKISDIKHRQ